MSVEVVMPKLGMAMKEGTVSIWNKQVGDRVGKGEPIASVSSEKIEIDVESPAEGTLLEIAVPEGEGVPPGAVICYIGHPGEKIAPVSDSVQTEEPTADESPVKETPVKSKQVKTGGDRVKISPVARKMAEAGGINISEIQGTGPGGRITKEDVQEAMKQSRVQKAEEKQMDTSVLESSEQAQEMKVSGIRKVIAGRMHDSLQQTAQLTMNMKVDVTELISLQKQTAETVQNRYENKLTVTDFIARAVVLSLQQHPHMNSAYINETIHLFKHVHLGMAVAIDKGLVVPVIRHSEKCSLIELSSSIKTLAQKARGGQLSSEEMQGSTFTISNLGSYGIEHFTPILNPPESGILGVGAVYDTPVFKGETIEKRSILPLSLTFDHRVLDGAPAAAFLQTVKQFLEEPVTMLL
ncbi:dihydrolipoamide acetyltransferase family protein [Cytobacillus oceanisediminis]|uniref:dihydrolipoamide acetyltransferase family protein n=1 Tax=Cytobacillus oceanisediminis TaxID=665099 RepID=UPI001FB3A743|nr:dihydrolipoamide acetyltransferase family protein [Cytobacillus oceanisediminis]UOE53582.1 2-oxo acid dehydrogenase subunit E2 [Cytobacillus oceanisediminis]